MSLDMDHVKIGDETPEASVTITREQIKDYAELSFDHNPLHVNEAFAKASMFGGIIAHGTIPLAYVYSSLFEYLGVAWIKDLRTTIKLIAPVRPGDTVTCRAKVKAKSRESVSFELMGVNQRKETFIVGEANLSVL